MNREDIEVEDLGIASVETRGDIVGESEGVGLRPLSSGISDD